MFLLLWLEFEFLTLCQKNGARVERDSFSPAGSVRVGYGLPSAGHSLPSALRCPKFLCSLPLREISTAARFTPCLLPPPAAARRETPFESPSYQKRKALLRSAFLFWQPNRDSNPNIQSQSLLCYRYTISHRMRMIVYQDRKDLSRFFRKFVDKIFYER